MTTAHTPRPVESLERCSLRAELRGDPMLGTAFPAARLLLVEQPGPWGSRGLRDSHFDPATANALTRLADAAGVRIEIIRHPGRTPDGAQRRWALADTRDGRESVRWGRFTRDDELLQLDLSAERPAGSAVGPVEETSDGSEPLYLVCAHSKHDACCALRGRPVAAALEAARPGRVWECSHLGGDRFAANVLVLPTGLLYGRVLPLAAEEFAAAAETGEVVGALLRGRIGLAPVAQAAVAFAHEHLALRYRRDITVVSAGRVLNGTATVRLRTPHGRVDVTVAVERVAASGLTCGNPGPNQYFRYRPLTAMPVTE